MIAIADIVNGRRVHMVVLKDATRRISIRHIEDGRCVKKVKLSSRALPRDAWDILEYDLLELLSEVGALYVTPEYQKPASTAKTWYGFDDGDKLRQTMIAYISEI